MSDPTGGIAGLPADTVADPSDIAADVTAGAAAEAPMRTERTAGFVRAGGTMAVATLVSRATGFVAKAVMVAFLGFSVANDSYSLANTLPNIIFELLLGGVLTSVAIPLLSRARTDPDGGHDYTQRLMTMMVVGLLAATAVAVAAAPLITRLYLLGSSSADPTLATHLAYLLLPQIFFYGVAALFGAILNTKEHFAAPAWAPVANNLVVIAVGGLLLALAGPGSHGGLMTLSRGELLLLGAGTTAGIVVQAVVMLPALWRSGFRFGWRWGIDARMREAGRLLGWAIGYALISQAGYVVTVWVSWGVHKGFYALYSYGSMLFQLPYGILGVSLLTAIMPRMSRHAANGEMRAVKHDMGVANRLSAVALVPVTAAMIALALPLATVTARYGAVDVAEVRILAWTLAAFAIGLLPLAITLVQMRVFYAMKDGRTPTVINAIMVAVRIPLLFGCLALPVQWAVPGLALAMSASYVVGVAVGEVWLRFRFGRMGFGATLTTIGRAAAASAAGGLAAWAVTAGLMSDGAAPSLVGAIGQLLVGALVGLVVTGAALMLLRVEEVEVFGRRVGGWLGRRAAGLLTGVRARMLAGRTGAPLGGFAGGVTAGAAESGADTVADRGTLVTADRPGPGGGDNGHGAGDGGGLGSGLGSGPGGAPGAVRDSEGQKSVTDQHSDRGGGLGSGQGSDPADAPHAAPLGDVDEELTRVPRADAAQAAALRGAGTRHDPSASSQLRPGTVIGERYRLTRLVVTDAVGNEYWQARDTVLPRDMAVTVLPGTDPTSATVTRTLRVGRLHHPGLPQTLDMGSVGRSAGTPGGVAGPPSEAAYLAGQWVDGATVTDLLQEGPLEERIAARLIAGVADAVAEVHATGLALGALHPSLVRVNFDGQVRLSHVVARTGSAPEDDIRALGGLLYLMITGYWPLDAAEGPAGMPQAPRRGGVELPATKVVASAPAGLSRLAERALHPEGGRGITRAADIAELAAPSGGAATPPLASGTGRGERTARADRPRTQRPARPARSERDATPRAAGTTPAPVLRDRRIKLSIAGVMLTVLAVLIVIMVASVTKQFLAGIVQPIEAADQQKLITATTPSTTLSVGATTTPGTTETGTETETAPAAGPAAPVDVANATVYDPQGTPPADYESYVDRAFDGDQSTVWPTWVYRQQFGPGGIKDGVGLLLSFAKPVTPATVTVSTTTPGTTVQIRSAASAKPALDSTTVLGQATLGKDPVSITLDNAPSSKYLVVWITKLAPYQGTSAKNQGQFQSDLAEISVTGS